MLGIFLCILLIASYEYTRCNNHLITYEDVLKMNKTELTKVVAKKTELKQKEAVVATQAVLDMIINS